MQNQVALFFSLLKRCEGVLRFIFFCAKIHHLLLKHSFVRSFVRSSFDVMFADATTNANAKKNRLSVPWHLRTSNATIHRTPRFNEILLGWSIRENKFHSLKWYGQVLCSSSASVILRATRLTPERTRESARKRSKKENVRRRPGDGSLKRKGRSRA